MSAVLASLESTPDTPTLSPVLGVETARMLTCAWICVHVGADEHARRYRREALVAQTAHVGVLNDAVRNRKGAAASKLAATYGRGVRLLGKVAAEAAQIENALSAAVPSSATLPAGAQEAVRGLLRTHLGAYLAERAKAGELHVQEIQRVIAFGHSFDGEPPALTSTAAGHLWTLLCLPAAFNYSRSDMWRSGHTIEVALRRRLEQFGAPRGAVPAGGLAQRALDIRRLPEQWTATRGGQHGVVLPPAGDREAVCRRWHGLLRLRDTARAGAVAAGRCTCATDLATVVELVRDGAEAMIFAETPAETYRDVPVLHVSERGPLADGRRRFWLGAVIHATDRAGEVSLVALTPSDRVGQQKRTDAIRDLVFAAAGTPDEFAYARVGRWSGGGLDIDGIERPENVRARSAQVVVGEVTCEHPHGGWYTPRGDGGLPQPVPGEIALCCADCVNRSCSLCRGVSCVSGRPRTVLGCLGFPRGPFGR